MAGYIHLYTGNGKGKTTTAFGLALRAAGAGMKIFIAQFVKGMHYAEIDAIQRFPEIELKQYGLDCFIVNEPTENDIIAARKGLEEVSHIISENKANLLILDEICIALHYHLFEIVEVVELLKNKPTEMEIVMTGRYAPPALYKIADLVTEMNEIKHYYNQGVQARKGIEF
ncbi:MAG: cob(I)yrinic acid a,c-diamide adenosyltransferase [Lentimicrobium sp.]|jgi:cob(I)alamin adenosyltransferase|nr:cob(I)yrinic acid a,c-diamide adenosyltransferase [Lentimicrobium sp.]